MMEMPGVEQIVYPEEDLILDAASAIDILPLAPEPSVRQRLDGLERERQQAFRQAFRMAEDLQALVAVRDRHIRELQQARRESFYRLALVAECRASGSAARVLRMGVMAPLLAARLGCDDAFCDRLQLAAPLHDLGQIAIPESILHKPAPLAEAELALVRRHPRLGFELLAGTAVADLDLAAAIALAHHEHVDGSGYPDGLVGEGIPLGARIVAVLDAFDALTLERADRPGLAPEEAVERVLQSPPGQFDPTVLAAFAASSETLLAVRWAIADERRGDDHGCAVHQAVPERGFWRRFT